MAYALRDKDLIRTLLNFGADPSLRDTKTNKCLLDLIRETGDSAADIAQLVSDCFMQSIVQANVASLEQYLRAGFELNPGGRLVLPDANSYLHWAVMYANEPVVRLLLDNGASVTAVNKSGSTPLHEAVLRKSGSKDDQLRIIETLLVHKADAIHTRGSPHDLCALDLAASHADPEVHALIRDFVADMSSMTSSVPASPMVKTPPAPPPPTQLHQSPPTSPKGAIPDSINHSPIQTCSCILFRNIKILKLSKLQSFLKR